MIYVFSPEGRCLERNTMPEAPPRQVFELNYGPDIVLVSLESDPAPGVPLKFIGHAQGQLTVDPSYSPPAPEPPVDLQAEMAELKAVVAANLLASPHDRRWLAQKEAAKGVMAWMQANPACDQAQVEAQVAAAMQAATPGEPVVIAAAGLVQSYADEAARRGLVPAASFESLKALVLASSSEQLRQMLAVL